jgi:photosystem II stability/assembly factor-like uncharacterized protein
MRLVIFSVLCSFVALSLSASGQQSLVIRSMKLLNAQTGWAATNDRLFWTTNGGAQWMDITPRLAHKWQSLSSVFFLDASTGWVLMRCADRINEVADDTCFEIASTTNSGGSWSVVHPKIVDPDPESGLSENGYINFADPLHGWTILKVNRSTAVSFGIMFSTQDGGRTWEQLPEPPIAESFRFVSPVKGWIAGGPNLDLYVTNDAGNSWRLVSVPKPNQVGPVRGVVYDLPVFSREGRGFLPVKYKVGSELGPPLVTLALFTTNDNGSTWELDQILPTVVDPTDGWLAVALPDSTALTATVSEGRIDLMRGRPGQPRTQSATIPVHAFNADQLSFIDSQQGWVLASSSLLSTLDGGLTWTSVTPASGEPFPNPESAQGMFVDETSSPAASLTPPDAASLSSACSPPSSACSQVSRHLGFDKSDVPTTTQMQQLMTSSPFYDTFIYLPGSPNRHVDGTLTQPWVTAVEGRGWGIVPIWFGLQSQCVITKTNISEFFTSAGAVTQGQAQATLAFESAKSLGITGGTIFLDIENYNPTCTVSSSVITAGPIVQNYVNAFVSAVKAHPGYSAGVYANPGPLSRDISKIGNQPAAVWIAKTPNVGSPPQVTIWNLGISDSLWPKDQRSHQFLIQQTKVAFGGVPLLPSVDEDIDDSPAWRSENGGKTRTYCPSSTCYSTFDLGDGTDTEAFFINDVYLSGSGPLFPVNFISTHGEHGQIVGTFHGTDGLYHGFVLNQGQTAIQFDCGNPVGTTTPEAINSAGLVVGSYVDANGNTHGFEYNSVTGICQPFPDYPGADFTEPRGINDAGWVDGGHHTSTSVHDSFIWKPSPPTFTSIAYFGADGTHAAKINGLGQTAGYDEATFVSFLGNGTCATCFTGLKKFQEFPTLARGVNNNDEMSGQYAITTTTTTVASSTTQTLPIGVFGVEYSIGLPVSFGTPPYNWQLTGGQLPNGLTLRSDGELLGTPAQVGTFNFSIKVTDSSKPPQTETASLSIQIIDVKGFFYSSDTKAFNASPVSYPGAPATAATGMNDFGQIVGFYADSAGNSHAFIAVPQETLK